MAMLRVYLPLALLLCFLDACHHETPGEAIARYSAAIRQDSSDAGARYHRGLAYLALGNSLAAAVDFEAAIHLRPDFAEAHYQRGLFYAPSSNDWFAARAEYDTALRLNPGFAEVYVARAAIRGWNGVPANNDSILEDIRKALGLNPRLATAYVLRGDFKFFLLRQADSALADYATAIRLAPGDAQAYERRADLYKSSIHKSPDYDRAIADYGEAIRLAPDSGDYHRGRGHAYFLRGRTHGDTNDFRRAVRDFTAALAIDTSVWSPQSLPYRYRGLAHVELGELDLAIADFTNSLQESFPEEATYLDRGLAYVRRGDRTRARADFRKIVALHDDTLLTRAAREQLRRLGAP